MEEKIRVLEYVTDDGYSPFERWFNALDFRAALKVTTALARLENGNFSNVKGVTGGIFEYVIDFGPGYRIYFGKDGQTLVILLGGGTKRRQGRDIDMAGRCWRDYKKSKKIGARQTGR